MWAQGELGNSGCKWPEKTSSPVNKHIHYGISARKTTHSLGVSTGWGAIAFSDISDYELAFPETAWGVGYLTHLYFHPHLIKPTETEWTLKVKGETVLDHVVFWFGCADWQVKACRSPFSLWDLAGKALLAPIRKEAEWQFKCH